MDLLPSGWMFLIIVAVTLNFAYAAVYYAWPLAAVNSLMEIKFQTFSGKKGCSVTSGVGHPDLQYDTVRLLGKQDSFVDLTVKDTGKSNNGFAMTLLVAPDDILDGVAFRYTQDNPSVNVTLNIIKGIVLYFNSTHMILSISGPNSADFGTLIVSNSLTLGTWTMLGINYENNKSKIQLLSDDSVLGEIVLATDSSVGVPGTLRIGESQSSKPLGFNGRVTCCVWYDDKININNVAKYVQECATSLWPQIYNVQYCPKGYFELDQKDVTLAASETGLPITVASSKIQCAYQCLGFETCFSFLFDKANRQCRLLDADYHLNLVPNLGSNYYTRLDKCC